MKLITVEKERQRYARFYKPTRADRETEARAIAKRKGAHFPKGGGIPQPGTKGRRLYNNAMRQLQRYSTEGAEKRTPKFLDDYDLIEIIEGLKLDQIVIVDFQLCGTFVCSEDTRSRCVMLHPGWQGKRIGAATVRTVLTSDDVEDQGQALMSGSELRSSCEVEDVESVMVVKK